MFTLTHVVSRSSTRVTQLFVKSCTEQSCCDAKPKIFEHRETRATCSSSKPRAYTLIPFRGNFRGETDSAINSGRLWKVASSWRSSNSRDRGGNAGKSRTSWQTERGRIPRNETKSSYDGSVAREIPERS